VELEGRMCGGWGGDYDDTTLRKEASPEEHRSCWWRASGPTEEGAAMMSDGSPGGPMTQRRLTASAEVEERRHLVSLCELRGKVGRRQLFRTPLLDLRCRSPSRCGGRRSPMRVLPICTAWVTEDASCLDPRCPRVDLYAAGVDGVVEVWVGAAVRQTSAGRRRGGGGALSRGRGGRMGHGCLTRSGMGSWTLNAPPHRPDTLAPSLAPQDTVPAKHIEFFLVEIFFLSYLNTIFQEKEHR
jgi:hypothetical protein